MRCATNRAMAMPDDSGMSGPRISTPAWLQGGILCFRGVTTSLCGGGRLLELDILGGLAKGSRYLTLQSVIVGPPQRHGSAKNIPPWYVDEQNQRLPVSQGST